MADLAGTWTTFCAITELRWLTLAFCLLATLAGFSGVSAETMDRSENTERQVKVAYLFKFGSYVEWPDGTFLNSETPLKIGFIDADPLADDLAQMVAGHSINGRLVTIRRFRREDSIADINVLFIGNSTTNRLAEILAMIKGRPVLTVTESENALALGSMINLIIIEGKVRFEVAPKPVVLGISARLLAAAHKVLWGGS
jgi:hypothetical protein